MRSFVLNANYIGWMGSEPVETDRHTQIQLLFFYNDIFLKPYLNIYKISQPFLAKIITKHIKGELSDRKINFQYDFETD